MTSPSTRDQGLVRISSLTRWIAAAAVGVTGLFAVLAARPTTANTASTSPQPTAGQASSGQASAGLAGGGLQAPNQLPFAVSGPGRVTSGGS